MLDKLTDKLIPKISDYAVDYWDGFLGVCLVLCGMFAYFQKLPHVGGLVACGLALNAFSMARRSAHHIGNVRRGCQGYWPDICRQAFPAFFAWLFWLFVLWGLCSFAAQDFGFAVPWTRWFFELLSLAHLL